MTNLPNKENTAILIVTYNPNERLLNSALSNHKKIADTLIIVDNNSENYNTWSYLIEFYDVSIQRSPENRGIAWALNKGIDLALEKGMKYVLTFDQDSIPVTNILTLYARHYTDKVGLIGSVFSNTTCRVTEIDVEDTVTVITSGCLHNLEAYKKIGPYDENLFIDCVDFEFAIRMKISGYQVLRSSTPLLLHHLGDPIKKWGLISSNHSCIRRYYISRNNVLLTKKYIFKVPSFIIRKNYTFIKDIIKLIIIEKNRFNKLKSIIRGLKDGILNN